MYDGRGVLLFGHLWQAVVLASLGIFSFPMNILARGVRCGLKRRSAFAALGLAITTIAVSAAFGLPHNQSRPQTGTATAFGPEFKYDVASIKPNKSANSHFFGQDLPDGISVRDVPLRFLFLYAYGNLRKDQILGTPDWFDSAKYDVVAKMDSSVADKLLKLAPPQRRLARQQMLRELLADRFKLKVHTEVRQIPIYFLTVAKGGFKLREGRTQGHDNVPRSDNSRVETGSIGVLQPGVGRFQEVSMVRLAQFLGALLGRNVIDKTGLAGRCDFTLRWEPTVSEAEGTGGSSTGPTPRDVGTVPNAQPALSVPEPSKFPALPKALEQQLGLKLEPGTGPVQVIVIDHVEPPSQN